MTSRASIVRTTAAYRVSLLIACLLLLSGAGLRLDPKATGTAGAQSKPPATEVVDGATTPDLIPDDRALHLILLAASAMDGESEESKNRAGAVIRTIFPTNVKDAAVLETIAKNYRTAVQSRAKEGVTFDTAQSSQSGQRPIAEASQEARDKLPEAAHGALWRYIRTEAPYEVVRHAFDGRGPCSEAHCPVLDFSSRLRSGSIMWRSGRRLLQSERPLSIWLSVPRSDV